MGHPPRSKNKKLKGKITVNSPVICPVYTLLTRGLVLTLCPLEITSVRTPLLTSIKNKGKYVILFPFYVFLFLKQKNYTKKQEKKDLKVRVFTLRRRSKDNYAWW